MREIVSIAFPEAIFSAICTSRQGKPGGPEPARCFIQDLPASRHAGIVRKLTEVRRSTMELPKNDSTEFVKNSVLYKDFLAEREEIFRHKRIESEKAGHDIGFEWALLDWIVRHRSAWREKRQRQLNNV